jgi:hypothetical protein
MDRVQICLMLILPLIYARKYLCAICIRNQHASKGEAQSGNRRQASYPLHTFCRCSSSLSCCAGDDGPRTSGEPAVESLPPACGCSGLSCGRAAELRPSLQFAFSVESEQQQQGCQHPQRQRLVSERRSVSVLLVFLFLDRCRRLTTPARLVDRWIGPNKRFTSLTGFGKPGLASSRAPRVPAGTFSRDCPAVRSRTLAERQARESASSSTFRRRCSTNTRSNSVRKAAQRSATVTRRMSRPRKLGGFLNS